MAWKIEISDEAESVLAKMNKTEQRRFDKFLKDLQAVRIPAQWVKH
ncbi:MAG: hypothetical protein IJS99_06985 [Synergistaceae bacterium]|nr:hypothetical protein [Synergistaceae bacterium]